MATVDIIVTDLTFPKDLKDAFCKFRPLISLRYRDANNKILFAREALPGLGNRDYWECEKDNKNKGDYVRHDTEPKVDMDKLDIMKREIIFNDIELKSLERIEIELFDIDIKVGWEKVLQTVLKSLPANITTLINPALPLTLNLIKEALEKGSGKKVADLEKGLISKAIGKDDGAARSIWARSKELTDPLPETLTLTGPGTEGNYSMTLKIEVI